MEVESLSGKRSAAPTICAPAPDSKHAWRAYQAVYVAPTRLGQGVFAKRFFTAAERVGRVTGIVINDPDYTSDYAIELKGHYSLEPSQPFCYLNHSCEPNCELTWIKVENRRGKRSVRVAVDTIRAIEPGEELTIDYAWPADAAIRCGCETASCRGWIVHVDELDALR